MNVLNKPFWVGVFIILVLAGQVRSDEIRLRADGTGEYGTIQEAIGAAFAGDEIVLEPGFYRGAGNRDLDMGGKALTIRSTDPDNRDVVETTVIDCQGSTLEMHRGFYFGSEEELDSVVAGLTIEHGYQVDGGAIYCSGQSSPTIRNCIIQYNQAAEDGGGIKLYLSCHPWIIDCEIINNTAGNYAGGIDCFLNCNATIVDCRISFNQSFNDGGGLQACQSNVSVKGCVFEGNSSQAEGGGMFCRGRCEIRDCMFIGNRAAYGGGIHFWEHRNATVIHCTIADNRAISYGGGFSGDASDPNLLNCILWGNTAGTGQEIALDYFSIIGSEITISYCCLAGGESGIHRKVDSIVHWGPGNITVDPRFFDRGYWDTNGTPADLNDDQWIGGDYHLQSKAGRWDANMRIWREDEQTMSPCIDAGDPGSVWQAELWPNGGRVNMGAYGGTAEGSMSLNSVGNIADLNHDGAVNFADWNLFREKWLWREVLLKADLDRDGAVDFRDWNIFGQQWLWLEEILAVDRDKPD